jgi:hypothetical protein
LKVIVSLMFVPSSKIGLVSAGDDGMSSLLFRSLVIGVAWAIAESSNLSSHPLFASTRGHRGCSHGIIHASMATWL